MYEHIVTVPLLSSRQQVRMLRILWDDRYKRIPRVTEGVTRYWLIFKANQRYWGTLHIPETFSSGTYNHKQTNNQKHEFAHFFSHVLSEMSTKVATLTLNSQKSDIKMSSEYLYPICCVLNKMHSKKGKLTGKCWLLLLLILKKNNVKWQW